MANDVEYSAKQSWLSSSSAGLPAGFVFGLMFLIAMGKFYYTIKLCAILNVTLLVEAAEPN